MMSRKLSKIIIFTVVCIIVLPAAVSAIPLSAYKTQIGNAAKIVEDLIYTEDFDLKTESDREIVRAVNQIGTSVPVKQIIEFDNLSVEADNNALHEKLKAFESETDSFKRLKIAQDVSEYLSRLETELDKLENRKTAERSKDQDRRKLNEILSRAEYQKPEEKKENPLVNLIGDFFKWLESLFPKPNPESISGSGMPNASSALQIIIWLAVFGIIGFLVYRFAPVLLGNLRAGEKKEKKSRVILGETIAAEETSENLFGEAEKLALAGDMRAAIRKGYIALLVELSDRKIIGLARHKTNRDYLRDVRSRDTVYRNMRGLTASFERHWYGFDRTDKSDWEEFKKIYSETIRKV